MATQDKPLVCIVHGSWHPPHLYRPLIDTLRAAGRTVLCPPLATSNYDDSVVDAGLAEDVKRIHGVLLPELDKGRKAIIVAHSYGGAPGNMAVEGQTVAEREKKGLKGGIVGVVYISCLPGVKPGASLYDIFGDSWPTSPLHYMPKDGLLPLKPAESVIPTLYNDIDEARGKEAYATLSLMSIRGFYDPIPFTGTMIEVPKTFIVCLQDKAVPAELQRIPANIWGARVVEIDAGHSPFLKDEALGPLVNLITEAPVAA